MRTPDDHVDRMTLDERIGLLSGDGPWSVAGVPRMGVPGIVLADGPHGVRYARDSGSAIDLDNAVPATCFPTAAGLGATWDVDLVEEVGRALGTEARALGVDVLLGPGLNLKRHPRGGRNFEYLSEDPVVSGLLAGAMVRGVQSQGVAACLKHVAVNNQESHRMVVDVVIDPRTLHELYLTGFELAVRHGRPWTAMCAYNRIGGVYASQHAELLTGQLRTAWGFDGVVMSDWGAVDDRVKGVRAGLDLEMPGGARAHDARIIAAIETGDLPTADIDRSAARVVQLIRRVRPAGVSRPDPVQALDEETVDAHHRLARRAAAAGTVLLKNEGDLLPLRGGGSLALIGPFADAPRIQGVGSSKVTPTRVDVLRDQLPGEVQHDDGSSVERAAAIAAAADVAVVTVGLDDGEESEGFDRDHLRLPAHHDALVRAVVGANPRTVVILSTGAPVELPWVSEVPAILTGYLGGQAGAGALADVLTGRAEPGGRLAETWPADDADVPATANFPGHPRQVQYREGSMVGYRAAVTLNRWPAFAFGHGLSYTRIDLSSPTLSSSTVLREHLTDGQAVTVTVTATNVGDRRGSEVVQVYVSRQRSALHRPTLELKAFAKIHLEPGEVSQVALRLGQQAFRHHDPQTGWQVEEGPAEILIGTSATAITHRLALQIGGGVGAGPTPTPPAVMDEETFARALGRAIPAADSADRFDRNTTIGELRRTAVGRRMRTQLLKAVVGRMGADTSPATRKAIERSTDQLPLRVLVLFSDGALTFDHLAAMLDALHGRWGSAARRTVRTVARGIRR